MSPLFLRQLQWRRCAKQSRLHKQGSRNIEGSSFYRRHSKAKLKIFQAHAITDDHAMCECVHSRRLYAPGQAINKHIFYENQRILIITACERVGLMTAKRTLRAFHLRRVYFCSRSNSHAEAWISVVAGAGGQTASRGCAGKQRKFSPIR